MKLKSYLLSGIVIVLISILLFPNVSGSYPEFLYGHPNNNVVGYSGGALSSTPAWSFDVGHSVTTNTPIVATNGNIYFLDNHVTLYCIYPSGVQVWAYSPPLDGATYLTSSINVLLDESYSSVIIGYRDSDKIAHVRCINMNTGVSVWVKELNTDTEYYWNVNYFAHESGNQYLYFVNMATQFSTTYSRLVKMDINDGTFISQELTAGYKILMFGKPVLVNSTIVVYGYDGNSQRDTISCFWLSNITERWKVDLGLNQYINNVVEDSDYLYFTTQDTVGSIISMYASNGTVRWHTNIGTGGNVGGLGCYPLIAPGYSGIPMYNPSRLFVVSSSGGYVRQFSTISGVDVQFQQLSGASQFMSGGTITYDGWWYIPDADGSVWKVSCYDMTIYSEWRTGSAYDIQGVFSIPGDGIMYICSGNYLLKFMQTTPLGIILSISSIGSPSNIYIGLNWTLPTLNGTDPLLGFKLFRSLDNITFYNTMSFTNTTLTYTDSSIAGDMDYYYYVLGYNINGDGTPSNIVTAKVTMIIIEGDTGIVGAILPFMMAMFMALFVSIIYDKRFSLSMFLICFGMMISVLVWLEAIPTYGMVITIILYVSVIWMAYSQSGSGANE